MSQRKLFFLLLALGAYVVQLTQGDSGVLHREDGNYVNSDDKKVSGKEEVHHAQQSPLSFDDIWDSRYRPKGFSASWIEDSSVFTYRNEDGSVYEYNTESDSQTKLLDAEILSDLNSSTYFVSADKQFILIAYQRKRVWRHSFTAKCKIYEVTTRNLIDFPNGPLAGEVLQYARWGPKGHSLAFVHGNNFHFQAAPNSPSAQITSDGETEVKFNGIPDWVYEEDVLTVAEAHYWSPDAKRIVYASFDTSRVPRQQWPDYGDKTNVFPELVEIAYPKAGDVRDGRPGPNTEVELFVVDTEQPESQPKKISPPEQLANQDHYYTRVTWRNNDSVFISWVNRVQNRTIKAICKVTENPVTCINHDDFTQENGWIDSPAPSPVFLDGGSLYVTVEQDSETENLNRLLRLVESPDDRSGSVLLKFPGSDDVMSVAGYDREDRLVYYISTNGQPTERHLFRVGLPSAEPENRPPVCLTCDLGEECRYVSASFSNNGKNYILRCRGPGVPVYRLKSTNNPEKDVILENNDQLRENLASKDLPNREFIEVDITKGYKAWAEMFYPPNYSPDNKYPILVYTYAGPGTQRVVKTFPMGSTISNWLRYLSSTWGVIVASVDGRGASGKGDEFLFEIYRKLGDVEVEDQIAAGREFQKMPFINSDLRSAIFGWSYGGHTASHVVGDTDDVFTCGIAVAPVTAKTYYDTAYTERYLAYATEDDNAGGYDREDVMNKAANFKDKKYLIAHGTADDNVHFMHMTQMIQALVDADVQFRQLVYPDADHYIAAPKSSRHLFRAMTEFLLNDCWEGEVDRNIPNQ